MEPFKFRVWDKKIKQFSDHYTSITDEGVLFSAYHDDYADNEQMDFLELSYSTGLFDKNGKEAFQGDIFTIDDIKFLIVWMDDRLMFACEYMPASRVNLSPEFLIPKSIYAGNKFENPELLESLK